MSERLTNPDLFRLAGIRARPTSQDGIYYVVKHEFDGRSDVLVAEDELAALVRDWWQLRTQRSGLRTPTDEVKHG